MTPLATHVLVDLWGLPFEVLNDVVLLEQVLRDAAIAARCEIVGAVRNQFQPHGASVVVLVAESHLSIHTWPEHAYAAVDIFTCGDVLPQAGVAVLLAALKPARHSVQTIDRGLRDAPRGA